MARQLIFDLPTRVFHWLFAGLFASAWLIANLAEHSSAFPYHMLAGLLLVALVVFRLIWGVAGTRYARFQSFPLQPAALLRYFRSIFNGQRFRWAGHNPASSWSALVLLAVAGGLGVTGYLMVSGGQAERYEDIHELLANVFLSVALLHVAGVVVHTLRHHDQFSRSMIDGRKADCPDSSAIPGARPIAGIVLLMVIAGGGVYLVRGYDPDTGALRLPGVTLMLDEPEEATGR